jgi:hypothetical protein
MAQFRDFNDPITAGQGNIAASLVHDEPSPGTPERLPGPSFSESLISGALLNNSVASVLAETYNLFGAGAKPEMFDASFNPRSWIEKNVPKETQDDLKDAIASGLFDEVPGPQALQRKLATASYERSLLQKEAGSWLGASLGALAGSVADPLTYLAPEAKWWQTGSTAIRLGKAITHAAASMAPQEAALWQTQDFRDWRQSLMNVGVGSVLGGGIGFFGRTLLRDNPYNPESRSNPLREENLGKEGASATVPGEGTDVIPHASVGEPGSVGAAATPSEAPEILGGRSAPMQFLMGFTPAGRALQWTSGTMRSFATKLMDLGGVYAKTDRLGETLGASAEDIRNDLISRWHSETGIQAEQAFRDTQAALKTAGAPRLNPGDLNATAYRLLTQTMTPEAEAELVAKYGRQGADAIKSGAQQVAAFRQSVNALQEAAMRRAGIIRDDGTVSKLQNELMTLREQRKAALEQHDQQTAQLVEQHEQRISAAEKEKSPAQAPDITRMRRELREAKVQRDAERREVHAQFDEAPVQKALDHERAKPPGLGADYGIQQRWEPGQIVRDREDFHSFLLKKLADQPAEHWLLDAHGLTAGDFEALKASDPAQHLAILREWAGEEHDVRLRQAENALEGARQREKLAKLDLNDTLRSTGVLKREERQMEVREYGRFRDQLAARVAAERELRRNLEAEGRSIAEAATAARQQGLDRQLAIGEPAQTTEFARQAERARQWQQRWQESEARLNRALNDQLTAERAYETARDARASRKDAREAMQGVARDVQAQRDLAGKNVPQAKRAVRAVKRGTPLEDEINNIVENLSSNGHLPASALESVVSDPGRFKERRLLLTPEEKIEAAKRGWLRTDLPNLAANQDRQIAAHLAIREAFDIGPGRTHESWRDVERRVEDEYRQLADKAGSDRGRGKLENEQVSAMKDLRGLKARLLGQVDPGGDRDGWLLWAQRQMRQYNFIRYAGGMLISSIPDFGAFALQHRVVPMLAAHAGEAGMATLKNLTPKLNTELRRMLSASEIALHGSMLSERMDEDALFRPHGIGAPGSLKNAITSRIDKWGEGVSHFAGAVSGLPQWDRFWKILSGLQMMHDLRDQVGRYGALSDLERTHLSSLGIGASEAERLQKFITQHGETDATSGLWDPMLEKWYSTQDGASAARDFRIAIQRDMNRSRFWPGMGDRPLIADKWYGKMFTQFQNFSFAFTNRYIAQFMQRAVHFQDIRAAASFAALMASAAVTMTIKDATRGITPDKRWNPQKPQDFLAIGHELMDRSFALGYLSPYADAAITLSGATGATRYERESVTERLLGINAALIGDAGRFAALVSGAAQGQAKPDKVIDKLTALAPFASLLRLGGHLYDTVTNGTPARDPYKK